MIRTSTGSGRRVLTFPAVQPGESISTLTLLDSLSRLAGDILSFKPEQVSTNKRNVRETFRHIHSLAVVLDEIRIWAGSPGCSLPDSAVSILSELHAIFQELKFLVKDCTRDGARIWMLMNSDRVSGLFRVLTRSISASLQGFPVGSTGLPGEVNELIDFVVRQTRKARVEPDPDDKRVVNSVKRILTEFENRVNPDPEEVNRVLDHVGIKKWNDCGKEMKFIEEEIKTERVDITEEEKNKTQIELRLLSGLRAFMLYCRCVMFRCIGDKDHKDDGDDDDDNKFGDLHGLVSCVNSDDLRCPISLEIMSDPVVIETGHTYDRSSISKWFRSGNLTCPKTGKNLADTRLVDNLAVKHVIKLYTAQTGVVSTEIDHNKKTGETRSPESLAARGVGKLLAGFLAGELINGGEEEEERISRVVIEVRDLAETSNSNRSYLVRAGVVRPLLQLLSSEDLRMQENAMAALQSLSKHVAGKSKIVENGGIRIIVEVLNKGKKTESRQNAASALFYLCSVGDYNRLIGGNPDTVPGLLNLIKGKKNFNDSTKHDALIAIMGLLIQQDNHCRVLTAGTVPVLLDLVRSDNSGESTEDSMTILAKLAERHDGTVAVVNHGGIEIAVKTLNSAGTSPAVRQSSVGLLLNLCRNGGSGVVALVRSPLVMESLYTVFSYSYGECGGSRKASALIRLIREYQERKPGSTGQVISKERFVRAW